MPVFTFKDMPRLGYRTKTSGWKKWGTKIADLIKGYDPAWGGLIHVSSKKQANDLANLLARSGLQDRVYIPEGEGTKKKISNWEQRKKKVPNTVAIAYSFHMGLDAPDLKFNILGKIPFKTLDRFGKAELDHNPGFYHLWAAILSEQSMGRTRRGNPEDYEVPGRAVNKVVAIADGNYIRIKNQFSSHFQNCLTQYD
jgi:Rad3-related DNA helicase